MSDILRKVKEVLDQKVQEKKDKESREEQLGWFSVLIDEAVYKFAGILSQIEFKSPEVTVNVPEIKIPDVIVPEIKVPDIHIPEIKLPTINIPEIKVPDINIPEIKLPTINVPEPRVTVNVPEIKIPDIVMPDEMNVKGFVSLMGINLGNPLPVQLRTADGAPLDFSKLGGTTSGGARVMKIINTESEPIPITGTISATFSADFGQGEVGSQTLRTVAATDSVQSVNIVGGSSSGATGQGDEASALRVVVAGNSAVSVSATQIGSWSVSVSDVFGSTAANVVNPDGRLKVELPSGASGLTDTELRANSLDVQQASGASWSTNVLTMPNVTVTGITNSTAVTLLNGDGVSLDPRGRTWSITETVPISSANTLDVQQVSGANWSVAVLSMPAVVVTSITNSTATALVDSTGVQYSGSNPIPVKEVRAATGTNSSVADNAASVTILASNTSRLGATVYNDSSATLYLLLGSTAASTTNYTCKIVASGYYEVPFGYTGQLTGIWASDPGDGAARVTEIT
jgi:hypothetical protein